MSRAKHTPMQTSVVQPSLSLVGDKYGLYDSRGRALAYASLDNFAAAPEMLEALESVLQDFIDGYQPKNVQQEITIKQISSAIAKARGES